MTQSADQLVQWANNAKLSQTGLQAAYFVATILNEFGNLPGGVRFDFATAITHWDRHHWAAFRDWTNNYLVTESGILPASPDERRLDPDL